MSEPQRFKDRITLLKEFLPHNALVAEVGVARGVFARHIVEVATPRRLHLIDVWLGVGASGSNAADPQHMGHQREVITTLAKQIKSGQVILHQGLSVVVAESFSDACFDWVNIDANHRYEAVSADLAAYAPKIGSCGYLAAHDWTPPDEPCVRRFQGVYRAVKELCAQGEWEIVARTEAGPKDPQDQAGSMVPTVVLRRIHD